MSLVEGFVAAVLLWDVETGKLVRRFQAPTMHPRSLSISPDGAALAAVDWDSGLRVWNIDTGAEISPPPAGHTALVRAVQYLPSSKQIVTASSDHTVRFWDAASGDETARLEHDAGVNVLAQSADGKTLATANTRDTVTLWELSPVPRKIREIEGGRQLGGARALVVSPDGSEVRALEDNLEFRVWGMADGELRRECPLRPSGVQLDFGDREIRMQAMSRLPVQAFAADGSKFILAGSGGFWWKFEATTGNEIARHSLPLFPRQCALSVDGGKVAFCGRQQQDGDTLDPPAEAIDELVLVDFETGGTVWQAERKGALFGPLGFSPDGRWLAAGARGEKGNSIELYDAATGQRQRVMTTAEAVGSVPQGFAFARDGKQLASIQEDSTVLVWDLTAIEK